MFHLHHTTALRLEPDIGFGAETLPAELEKDAVGPQSLFNAEEWNRIVKALRLSRRRAQIAERLLAGMTDVEIAAALGISKPTVRVHIGQMLRRFGVANRLALVVEIFATFRRLMEPESKRWNRDR